MKMNMTTFDFNGASVRTETVKNKPMFVANDVAKILGFKNVRDAISRHCKGVVKSDTLKAGGHPVSIISESDVYRLVMRSNLSGAIDFQDWVCETVLPSIRSNGGYIANQENDSPELIIAKALQVANNVIEEHKLKLDKSEAEVERLQGVCNTITAQFSKGMTPAKFCKQFNGVNVQQVNKSLVSIGMLQNSKEGAIPTSYARDKYFKLSYEDVENERTGWTGRKANTTLTIAGAKWLYKAYLSNKLITKKTWDGNFSHIEFKD